jgi:hypothetical protein
MMIAAYVVFGEGLALARFFFSGLLVMLLVFLPKFAVDLLRGEFPFDFPGGELCCGVFSTYLALLFLAAPFGVLAVMRFSLSSKPPKLAGSGGQFTILQILGATLIAAVLFALLRMISQSKRDLDSPLIFFWQLIVLWVLPPLVFLGVLRPRLYPMALVALAASVYAMAVPLLAMPSFLSLDLTVVSGSALTFAFLHLVALRWAGYRVVIRPPDVSLGDRRRMLLRRAPLAFATPDEIQWLDSQYATLGDDSPLASDEVRFVEDETAERSANEQPSDSPPDKTTDA